VCKGRVVVNEHFQVIAATNAIPEGGTESPGLTLTAGGGDGGGGGGGAGVGGGGEGGGGDGGGRQGGGAIPSGSCAGGEIPSGCWSRVFAMGDVAAHPSKELKLGHTAELNAHVVAANVSLCFYLSVYVVHVLDMHTHKLYTRPIRLTRRGNLSWGIQLNSMHMWLRQT